MLIFDSKIHYDNLILNGFEQYPNKRDLIILATYWLKNNIVSYETLKDYMIFFCKKCNSQFNLIKSEKLILSVMDAIQNGKNAMPENFYSKKINFTEKELNLIKKMNDSNSQSILFVIMSLCKWYRADYLYFNSNSSLQIGELFDFAGIKKTKKQQLEILHHLNDSGYISINLKPLLKCDVLVLDGNSFPKYTFVIDRDMIKHLNFIRNI